MSAAFYAALSRSKIARLTTEAFLNGKAAKLSAKVKEGDEVFIVLNDEEHSEILPEKIDFSRIYEDENVIVVNKKQGMVVHPGAGTKKGTLANALLFYLKEEKKEDFPCERPYIVHRLDKDTSGVMISAKNAKTHAFLSRAFRLRRVKKDYIAVTKGRIKEKFGVIDTVIDRDERNRKKFKAYEKGHRGKRALTLFHVIARYGEYSLVRLRLKTGRTHQIRVHLRHLHSPVLGDPLYCAKKDGVFPEIPLMLHARRLSIRINENGEIKTFYAPVPSRFIEVVSELKALYKRE